MNIVKKGFLTALIALFASVIQAAPPYHINNAATGVATIQSSGSCQTKMTYQGAQWGVVYDSMNVNQGWGIITATGDLLALLSDYAYISGEENNVSDKSTAIYFEDLDSEATIGTIESLAGCTVDELISSAKSKGIYVTDESKLKDDFSLVYPFNGISPSLEIVNGAKTIDKAQTFSGKITFKGSYMVKP